MIGTVKSIIFSELNTFPIWHKKWGNFMYRQKIFSVYIYKVNVHKKTFLYKVVTQTQGQNYYHQFLIKREHM